MDILRVDGLGRVYRVEKEVGRKWNSEEYLHLMRQAKKKNKKK